MKILKYKGYKKDWITKKIKEEKLHSFSFFCFIILKESKETVNYLINDKSLQLNSYNKALCMNKTENTTIAQEKNFYNESILEEIKEIESDNTYRVDIKYISKKESLLEIIIRRISNDDEIERLKFYENSEEDIHSFLLNFKHKEIKMSESFKEKIFYDLKNRFLEKYSIKTEDYIIYEFFLEKNNIYTIDLTNKHGKKISIKNININFYNNNINFLGINDFLQL